MIQKLKKVILDTIFPPRCLNCKRLGRYICDECAQKIIKIKYQNCPICHRKTTDYKLCAGCRRKSGLYGLVALGYFHDPVLKNIIHEYKYNGIYAAGDELAAMVESLIPPEIDSVTFAPMSRKRFNFRGYNQAEILAREIGRLTGKPVLSGLVKTRHTKSQVGLERRERLKNLEGAFVCRDNNVAGRSILLVDDVLTTGATLSGCAKALRRAGAKRIWALVLARE